MFLPERGGKTEAKLPLAAAYANQHDRSMFFDRFGMEKALDTMVKPESAA